MYSIYVNVRMGPWRHQVQVWRLRNGASGFNPSENQSLRSYLHTIESLEMLTVKVGAAGSWLHLASYVLVHASKYHHVSSPRCIQNIETSHIRILFSKEMDRADINLIICNFPDDFAPTPLLQTVQFLFWMDLSGTLADFLRAWERKTSGISSKWMMDGSYLCVFIPPCKENEIFLLMQALYWYYDWESYLKIYRKCVKKDWNKYEIAARCYTDWPTA